MTDKVIPINTQLKKNKKKEAEQLKKRKMFVANRLLRCLKDTSLCEKCGNHFSDQKIALTDTMETYLIPYRFCNGCRYEYIEYIRCLQGKGSRENFWHNASWKNVWQKWIDYQNSVDQYMKSKEFLQLLDEINRD